MAIIGVNQSLALKPLKNKLKTGRDPRHQKRREAIRHLFAYLYLKEQPLDPLSQEVVSRLEEIDEKIVQSAPEWPLERINKIDLAILRLAVFELAIQKKEPPKVIIDEAVELAKEFGSTNSAPFVNGVLGNILKKQEDEVKKQSV